MIFHGEINIFGKKYRMVRIFIKFNFVTENRDYAEIMTF